MADASTPDDDGTVDGELPPGRRVRAARQRLGLTQVDLAQAVGVSRQTVISMETGDYAPSVFLALKVAQRLSTTVEELWGGVT